MQTVRRQDQLFHALGDPTRRALYQELIASEETVCALTARFSISQPAISQHLKTLREAGLVKVRRQGRRAHYRASPQGLKPLLEWMARYEKFWRSRDAALKAGLKALDA